MAKPFPPSAPARTRRVACAPPIRRRCAGGKDPGTDPGIPSSSPLPRSAVRRSSPSAAATAMSAPCATTEPPSVGATTRPVRPIRRRRRSARSAAGPTTPVPCGRRMGRRSAGAAIAPPMASSPAIAIRRCRPLASPSSPSAAVSFTRAPSSLTARPSVGAGQTAAKRTRRKAKDSRPSEAGTGTPARCVRTARRCAGGRVTPTVCHRRRMSASSRLAAVNRNACALRDDGSPVCWGINYQPSGGVWYGQAHPAEGEQFTAISAGPHFTCALRQDGSPHCWGEGYETPEPARTTYEDITDESFVSVSTGWDYSCALRADGTTVCWGNPETETEPESSGRRGDFAREWPPEGERFTAISTGTSNTCGLRADGTAICWGENTNGAAFPPRDERFVAISCGDADTCGLRSDGTFECWGSVTGIPGRNIKPALQPGEQFKAISFGAFHVCALRQDGTPLCWGLDDYARHRRPPAGGTTSTARRRRPKVIASPASAVAVITPALCGPMAPPCAGAPRWATSTPPTATPPLLASASRLRPRASDSLRSAAAPLTPAGSARTGLRFAGARGSRPQPDRGRRTSGSSGRPLARPGSVESPSASTPGQRGCAPISRAPDRLPSELTGRV